MITESCQSYRRAGFRDHETATTGVQMRSALAALAGVVAVLVLGAAVFATFSLIIACLARVNPLTCQVDILRALMLADGHSAFGPRLDFAVLIGSLVVLIAVAARLYPRVVR